MKWLRKIGSQRTDVAGREPGSQDLRKCVYKASRKESCVFLGGHVMKTKRSKGSLYSWQTKKELKCDRKEESLS